MKKKTIINFCPTGMVPTKAITPFVPVTPLEIVEQTHEAYEMGITIVHLHARNDNETPTYKSSVYRDIFEGVRKHCPDLIICGSSTGRNWPEFEKRSEVIELKPDMCSLTLSSLNFVKQASMNAPDMIVGLAEKMKAWGVVPELECFDMGMINYGRYMINKGIIEGPYYWNLLFGNIAGFQANFLQMGTAISMIPESHYIGLAGLAGDQLPVNAAAIAMGYGVRVGIEDNIWWDAKRSRHATNTVLIQRIHRIMELHDAEPMTAKEFGEKGFYNRKS